MISNVTKIISAIMSFVFVIVTMANGDKPGTEVVINEDATNPYIMEYGNPQISAHRSGANLAPENTLMAFEYVIENNDILGVDIFEFDVQITRDGELVLLHNLTYDDTSNAKEAFGHSNVTPYTYTLEQLQCLNLGENFKIDGEYLYRGLRGEDIPDNLRVVNCETILDYIENNSNEKEFQYIIEIKSPAFWGKKAADKLYQILEQRDLLGRTIIGSFLPTASKHIDENYPDMMRSASIKEVFQFYFYCRMNKDLDELDIKYVALQLPYGANVMPWRIEIINLGTKEVINYAHKYNIAVQYWTCNDAENAIYLTENGADAIMTDKPDMIYETIYNP